MACYFPIKIPGIDKSGHPKLFNCGRCIGCRLEYSRQWAVRIVHESQMHEHKYFLTLTYRDEELIHGYAKPTLYPRHLQLFMKRLRKEYGNGIRFFACGEYGDRTNRPHYHMCLFGVDFVDRKIHSIKNGNYLYSSAMLNSLWTHGNCLIGDVTFESAAYVARYILDKKTGPQSEYYKTEGIEPEFVRMSRRPGIGTSWLNKFESDVFPHDYVVIRGGIKSKPPRFYLESLKPKDNKKYWVYTKKELDNLNKIEYIKKTRKSEQFKNLDDCTKRRLKDKEIVKKAQIQSLRR